MADLGNISLAVGAEQIIDLESVAGLTVDAIDAEVYTSTDAINAYNAGGSLEIYGSYPDVNVRLELTDGSGNQDFYTVTVTAVIDPSQVVDTTDFIFANIPLLGMDDRVLIPKDLSYFGDNPTISPLGSQDGFDASETADNFIIRRTGATVPATKAYTISGRRFDVVVSTSNLDQDSNGVNTFYIPNGITLRIHRNNIAAFFGIDVAGITTDPTIQRLNPRRPNYTVFNYLSASESFEFENVVPGINTARIEMAGETVYIKISALNNRGQAPPGESPRIPTQDPDEARRVRQKQSDPLRHTRNTYRPVPASAIPARPTRDKEVFVVKDIVMRDGVAQMSLTDTRFNEEAPGKFLTGRAFDLPKLYDIYGTTLAWPEGSSQRPSFFKSIASGVIAGAVSGAVSFVTGGFNPWVAGVTAVSTFASQALQPRTRRVGSIDPVNRVTLPERRVFGEERVTAWEFFSGVRGDTLDVLAYISSGEIQQVKGIFINGQYIELGSDGRPVQDSQFEDRDRIRVTPYIHAATGPALEQYYSRSEIIWRDQYHNTRVNSGETLPSETSYVHIELDDNDNFWSERGAPVTFEFAVLGDKVPDLSQYPNHGTSAKVYTDNSIAIRYAIETEVYGETDAGIEWHDTLNAYNIAEAELLNDFTLYLDAAGTILESGQERQAFFGSYPASQRKYPYAGQILSSDSPIQVRDILEIAANGYSITKNGKLALFSQFNGNTVSHTIDVSQLKDPFHPFQAFKTLEEQGRDISALFVSQPDLHTESELKISGGTDTAEGFKRVRFDFLRDEVAVRRRITQMLRDIEYVKTNEIQHADARLDVWVGDLITFQNEGHRIPYARYAVIDMRQSDGGTDLIIESVPVERFVSSYALPTPVKTELIPVDPIAEGTPGTDGVSYRDIAIYQLKTIGTADPATPTGGTYDFDTDVLTPPVGWTTSFPSYDPVTQEVACSVAAANSNDELSDWSDVRICAAEGDINIIFQRAVSQPGTPADDTNRVPAGWSDDPLSGTNQLWGSVGNRAAQSDTWSFSAPYPIGGTSYRELTIYQVKNVGAANPATPTGGSYNFGTDTLTAPAGWVRDFPAFDPATQEVVCSIALGDSHNTLGTWSAVRVCAGEGDLNIIFQRSASQPATPADGTDRVPTGWSDDPPAGTAALWGSVGHRPSRSGTWSFATPYQVGGTSYREVDLFQAVSIETDHTALTLPDNSNITYTFSTNSLAGAGLGSWVATRPTYNPETQKVVCITTTGSSDGHLGTWSPVFVCNADGDLNIIFQRAAAQPGTPPDTSITSNSGIPSGWHDDPPAGTQSLWGSVGHRPAQSDTWNYGTPYPIGGTSYRELTIYRTKNVGAANPATPTGGSYVFGTDTLTAPSGWSRTFPSYNPQTQEVVCSIALGDSHDTLGTWSGVRVCAGEGDLNIVWRRAASQPATPANTTNRVPSGWHETPPGGTDQLWGSVGNRAAQSGTWSFDTPFPTGGVSYREVTIYQTKNIGASNPGTPTGGSYVFGSDTLTPPSGWSRTFPNYNPTTQEVVCSIATGSSHNTLSGWSVVRVCAAEGDINIVFQRSATAPATPADGTARVPTGWHDDVPTGDAQLWSSVGSRSAQSGTWSFGAPYQTGGEDGTDGTDGLPGYNAPLQYNRILTASGNAGRVGANPGFSNTTATYKFKQMNSLTAEGFDTFDDLESCSYVDLGLALGIEGFADFLEWSSYIADLQVGTTLVLRVDDDNWIAYRVTSSVNNGGNSGVYNVGGIDYASITIGITHVRTMGESTTQIGSTAQVDIGTSLPGRRGSKGDKGDPGESATVREEAWAIGNSLTSRPAIPAGAADWDFKSAESPYTSTFPDFSGNNRYRFVIYRDVPGGLSDGDDVGTIAWSGPDVESSVGDDGQPALPGYTSRYEYDDILVGTETFNTNPAGQFKLTVGDTVTDTGFRTFASLLNCDYLWVGSPVGTASLQEALEFVADISARLNVGTLITLWVSNDKWFTYRITSEETLASGVLRFGVEAVNAFVRQTGSTAQFEDTDTVQIHVSEQQRATKITAGTRPTTGVEPGDFNIDTDGKLVEREQGATWAETGINTRATKVTAGARPTADVQPGDLNVDMDGDVVERQADTTWMMTGTNVMGDEGDPGAPGSPGASTEEIFALHSANTLNANQLPLNTWGFKQPQTRNGVTWVTGLDLQSLSDANPYIFKAVRDIVGSPGVGDAISGTWNTPIITAKRANKITAGTRPTDDVQPGDLNIDTDGEIVERQSDASWDETGVNVASPGTQTAGFAAATGAESGNITVSWDAVDGVTQFTLTHINTINFEETDVTVTGTSHTLTGLTPAAIYWLYLTPVATDGVQSDRIQVRAGGTLEGTAPIDFTASDITQTAATVGWGYATLTPGYGVRIQVATNAAFTANLRSFAVSSLTYSHRITGLSANTQYYVRIAEDLAPGNPTSLTDYLEGNFTTASTPPAAPTTPTNFSVTTDTNDEDENIILATFSFTEGEIIDSIEAEDQTRGSLGTFPWGAPYAEERGVSVTYDITPTPATTGNYNIRIRLANEGGSSGWTAYSGSFFFSGN